MPTEHLRMPKVDAATIAEVAAATLASLNHQVGAMTADDHAELHFQKLFSRGLRDSGVVDRLIGSTIAAAERKGADATQTMHMIVHVAVRFGMRLYPELMKREGGK